MENAFSTDSLDYLHRLILHEKAHFLWANVFDQTLKDDWIELGGWYEDTSRASGWNTTKQTEFVSAYAHEKNPNEDMAETLSFFIINPDGLRSRSVDKYEFVRDRIMQGNIYISKIREDLTFEVYNLYPDYVYPGKIKRLRVTVTGDPYEDKEIKVEVELHSSDSFLEGASLASMRIHSHADTYIDLYLYPSDGSSLSTILSGTHTLPSVAANGYWHTSQIVIRDRVGNQRMESANDFGWRMYVDNPGEDITKPSYIANSIKLELDSEILEGRDTSLIKASWLFDENNAMIESSACYGALNDELPTTYSIQAHGNAVNNECSVTYVMPDYMPTSVYRLNYIMMTDLAMNKSSTYFTTPSDIGAEFTNNAEADEIAPEIYLQTSNPDITPPELDLNNISVTATPTNPTAPNGETEVTLTFRVKDDISGYQIGSFNLRDPQGLTSFYYHYPPRRDNIYPNSLDLDWYEYSSTIILPAGSAPGTWGVIEMTLTDRANNFKTYDFTETITFETVSD